MTKYTFWFLATVGIIIAGAIFVYAQENTIIYPVTELGNCQSKEACRAYCELPGNFEPCLDFASSHGLMKEEDIKIVRQIKTFKGPGDCGGAAECQAYCEATEHFDECLEFAEEHNLLSDEELELAKKFRRESGPGGCRGIECKAYCDNPAHFEACLQFAEEHDLINNEEAEIAEKLGGAPGPGGCRGEECKDYCSNPEHREECFRWATEQGFIKPEEIERMEQMMNNEEAEHRNFPINGPGGCQTPEECQTNCREHYEECSRFSPPTSESFNYQFPEGMIPAPQSFPPPADYHPSEGMMPTPEQYDQYRQQYEQQYQQQYEQQFQQQYEQQYQQQYQQYQSAPPSSLIPKNSLTGAVYLLLRPFLILNHNF